jgi:hypothetical protein
MAAGIGLVVKINADTKKAVGDIKDVDNALGGMKDSTGKASKVFGALGSAALPVVGALVVGVGAAATAMIKFGQAAIEDKQEADKLARVLETIPGITKDMVDANEAWITSTMFATHVVDTQLREAISGLVLVTGDLGKAQEYAAKAADLATVANVEYDVAVSAVEKALVGKTRALMTLAPQLDTNKDGTLSLAEAQGILTDKTLEGMAAAAAAEDPWTTISLIWGEIQEALGQWILPLFERLGNWFKDPVNQAKIQAFIDKLGAMSAELGQKLLVKLDEFLAWLTSPQGEASINKWMGYLEDLAGYAGDVAEAVGWMNEQWQEFITSDAPRQMRSASLPRGAAPAGMSAGTFTAPSPAGVTVNFYGGVHTDPEATARAITSSLRSSDMRNARARPLTTQLEPAW